MLRKTLLGVVLVIASLLALPALASAGEFTGDYPVDPPDEVANLSNQSPRVQPQPQVDSDLADTGMDLDWVRYGIVLIGIGGVAVYAAKRRRQHVGAV